MKTHRRWRANLTGEGVSVAESIRKILPLVMLATVALCVPQTAAADSPSGEPDWEARIFVYGWFPAIYSHPSIGPYTTNINVTTDELFGGHFRWGGAGGVEDRYKDFLLIVDGMAAQFAAGVDRPIRNFPVNPGGVSGTVSTGPSEGSLRSTSMMIEGALGWRALSMLLSPGIPEDTRRFRLDLLVGPRLWYFRNKVLITVPPARVTVGGASVPLTSVMLPREVALGRVTLPGLFIRDGVNQSIETTTSWVDATIGFRASVDVTKTVSLGFRGDVGGFGIGNSSEFTWQALPRVEWRFAQHWAVSVGYRAIGIKKGRADDTIEYGALIGVGYTF
jgi:hypothetical protein